MIFWVVAVQRFYVDRLGEVVFVKFYYYSGASSRSADTWEEWLFEVCLVDEGDVWVTDDGGSGR